MDDINDNVSDISNSCVLHNELKEQDVVKFLKIRKQLVKELLDPDDWYTKNKVPKTVRYTIDKSCPYAQENERVIEHYWVWWKNHPNDPVKYNEEIRHLNGDVSDNRIENLVKISKKLHKKVHKDAAQTG